MKEKEPGDNCSGENQKVLFRSEDPKGVLNEFARKFNRKYPNFPRILRPHNLGIYGIFATVGAVSLEKLEKVSQENGGSLDPKDLAIGVFALQALPLLIRTFKEKSQNIHETNSSVRSWTKSAYTFLEADVREAPEKADEVLKIQILMDYLLTCIEAIEKPSACHYLELKELALVQENGKQEEQSVEGLEGIKNEVKENVYNQIREVEKDSKHYSERDKRIRLVSDVRRELNILLIQFFKESNPYVVEITRELDSIIDKYERDMKSGVTSSETILMFSALSSLVSSVVNLPYATMQVGGSLGILLANFLDSRTTTRAGQFLNATNPPDKVISTSQRRLQRSVDRVLNIRKQEQEEEKGE